MESEAMKGNKRDRAATRRARIVHQALLEDGHDVSYQRVRNICDEVWRECVGKAELQPWGWNGRFERAKLIMIDVVAERLRSISRKNTP